MRNSVSGIKKQGYRELEVGSNGCFKNNLAVLWPQEQQISADC